MTQREVYEERKRTIRAVCILRKRLQKIERRRGMWSGEDENSASGHISW